MEEKRYIFDKRVVKKTLIKYGVMFLILIPILLVVDYFIQSWSVWAVVGLDVGIGVVVIIIESLIYSAILKKKEEKKAKLVEPEKEETPKKENRGINRYPKKTIVKREKK